MKEASWLLINLSNFDHLVAEQLDQEYNIVELFIQGLILLSQKVQECLKRLEQGDESGKADGESYTKVAE